MRGGHRCCRSSGGRAFFEADERMREDVQHQLDDALAGNDHDSLHASDGLGYLFGALAHSGELNGTLANMGFDPDNLPAGV